MKRKKRIEAIHRKDAFALLRDGQPHKLRLWKLSTGEILTYTRAVYVSHHVRKGIHRVYLPTSSCIRAFRDITLFEIDDLRIYL